MYYPFQYFPPGASMSRPRTFDQQAVADAAMRAVWEGGLVATSVEALLQATGLSRSSMYQCLGNREEVLKLAVQCYVDQQAAALQRLFASQPLESALRKLLLDSAVDNHGGRGCLLFNGANELHDADDAVAVAVRDGLARMAAEFRAVFLRHGRSEQDSAERSAAVMTAIAGLRTMQRAGTQGPWLRAVAQRLAAALAAD